MKNVKLNLLFFSLTIILGYLSTNGHASELKIEPVYSIETTQRQFPKPVKTVVNNYLGARASYGVPLLSGELEVGQALRDEQFPETGEKVNVTVQRAMLGLRSYPLRGKYFGLFIRGGARARKEIRKTTDLDGNKSTDESDIKFAPYLGSGLTIAFGSVFALNAGATLIYNQEAPEDKRYDSALTLGFTFRMGNR